jgi:hypothetical protein
MKRNPKSEGKCLFCGETFTKTKINRHLQTHLEQKTKENASRQSYLVKIEPDPKWNNLPYFLFLWIDGKATMDNIDNFLRKIWLECCSHLSSFTNPQNRRNDYSMLDILTAEELQMQGKQKEYEKLMEDIKGEIPMTRKVNKVFYKGLTLNYKYDFGSSTYLLLYVVEKYPVKADNKIVLLSRNEPLELLCDICKEEPATLTCILHSDSMFCNKCAKKHTKKCKDFEEYAALPIVNSPRSGFCAYAGGSIDVKRDGVFVKKS